MILELLLAAHLQDLERRQAKGSLIRAARESIHAHEARTVTAAQLPATGLRRLEGCHTPNSERAA